MLNPPLLDGLQAEMIDTARLRTHIITGGPVDGAPVLFVHGNFSAARFWEEAMVRLPAHFRAIAPDLRGYGRSQAAPLDATQGMRPFADDLQALVETLGLPRLHLVGWSLGGCVVMQYTLDHPDRVASLTLVASGSPFGFGGTRDVAGTPTAPDWAGSGGGLANAEFVARVQAGDRSDESPVSPRNVMNTYYFKPPFRSLREDVLVDEILTTVCGPDNYPGDTVTTSAWPGVAPGSRGVNNALSPKYCDLSAFADLAHGPPVLWVRGEADQIVSDTSLFDLGYLGQLGGVPDWPGPDAYPPQPMIGQLRAVLDQYRANGGQYREEVLDCGHSPQIEQSDAFTQTLLAFLEQAK